MNNRPDRHSDTYLWSGLAQKNEVAFELLYKKYFKGLYYYGVKLTAHEDLIQDAIQELFFEFWNNRNSTKEVKNVKIYIFAAFRYKLNKLIIKSFDRHRFVEDEQLKDLTENQSVVDEFVNRYKFQLRKTIKTLPKKQKEVIHLKYYENLTNQEIAKVVNINYQSVSNLIFRAIKKLRIQMNSDVIYP